MKFDIKVYQDHENDFYCKMGHFFANRKYAFEMGGWQFYTKDKAVWFLAFHKNEVAGFCSAIIESTHVYLDNFYVVKKFRGKGLSKILFESRFNYCKLMGSEIRVISDNESQIKKYQKYGFVFYGKKGRYSKFKWNPNKTSNTNRNKKIKT